MRLLGLVGRSLGRRREPAAAPPAHGLEKVRDQSRDTLDSGLLAPLLAHSVCDGRVDIILTL